MKIRKYRESFMSLAQSQMPQGSNPKVITKVKSQNS